MMDRVARDTNIPFSVPGLSKIAAVRVAGAARKITGRHVHTETAAGSNGMMEMPERYRHIDGIARLRPAHAGGPY